MIAFFRNKIDLILFSHNWKDINYDLWISRDIKYGHCNSNLALLIAKKYHLPLEEVVEKLIKVFQKIGMIAKVICENGFLFFFLRPRAANDIINQVLEAKSDFGKSTIGQGKKVIYEWVSANPTGYLHFGHARNIFVGQVIVNLLEFARYDVTREFYINDHGNQVFQLGKTIFYYYQKQRQNDPKTFSEMYQNPEVEKLGALAYQQLEKKYQLEDFDLHFSVQKTFIEFGCNFFLNQMKEDLKNWGVEFDSWFSEKQLYQDNYYQKFLARLKSKKITYFHDGALWIDSSKTDYNQDFVLVKKSGDPTYFLGDIMYHDNKMERKFDLLVDLFGADHHSHFLKIVAGLVGLGWDKNKIAVDLLQMVKIVQSGENLKISKRKGTAISLKELIKQYGLNFLKFLLLSKKRNTPLIFDLDKLNNSSNRLPFFNMHYAYVRCVQLLKKQSPTVYRVKDYDLLIDKTETNLILNLHFFPFLIKKAVATREPQLLVDFLLKVCKNFHIFYQNVNVLHASDHLKAQRTDLVRAVYQLLSNIFKIIGFDFPKKMIKDEKNTL